jgi:hypothetical protein
MVSSKGTATKVTTGSPYQLNNDQVSSSISNTEIILEWLGNVFVLRFFELRPRFCAI